ncbi:MAG: hypothetical protein ACQGVC_18130 [Myxococcota bacterium]
MSVEPEIIELLEHAFREGWRLKQEEQFGKGYMPTQHEIMCRERAMARVVREFAARIGGRRNGGYPSRKKRDEALAWLRTEEGRSQAIAFISNVAKMAHAMQGPDVPESA